MPSPYSSALLPATPEGGLGMQGGRHSIILAPWKRLMALAMTLLLLLPSPSLMAITMGQIKAGVAGGASGGGKGSSPNLVNAGAASAALTAALTKKSQEQSAAVVTAMQKLQKQAATAAKANPANVPNGFKAGWLEPYVGKNPDGSLQSGFDANGTPITTTWNGAAFATPSDPAKAANPNYVNIKQTAQNAFLYWNKFNVGPATTVNFDQSAGGQSAGNWIAFNKVMSPSDPSHIFGNITAQGQVYVLNQNGILFHNGSTVNTHALVASTLPINQNLAGDALDNVTGRGIANNPDNQFLFTALTVPKSQNGTMPTFDPSRTSFGVSRKLGDVVVEKGASIVSPVNEAGVGGFVALIGPNVVNNGSISTEAGQAVLAAGLQVALNPHAAKDPTLRGMDVVIGAVSDARLDDADPLVREQAVAPSAGEAGKAMNNGFITFVRGNVTMAGKSVIQGSLPDDILNPVNNGHDIGAVLDSSTSVSLNGRVDLIASYGTAINSAYTTDGRGGPAYFEGSTGLVDLRSGSVLRILPEWASDATVIGNSLALNSLVNVVGRNIHLGYDSILLAPGAVESLDSHGVSLALPESGSSSAIGIAPLVNGITLSAGEWFSQGNSPSILLPSAGQIYLDQGAVIDASGSTDVQVDSAQNFLTLQLRGPELADSPLQRTSAVRGKDITIDIRNSGTYNGTYWIGTPLGKTAGYVGLIQKTVGQLTQAGGSVSLSAGDSVVMSPGSIVNVSGGWTQYSGGNFSTTKLFTTDGRIVDIAKATPDQIYTGILKNNSSVYEAPYFQGGDGGSVSISAPSVALQGDFDGNTVTGFRQLRKTTSSGAYPTPSLFQLNLEGVRERDSLVFPSSPYAPAVLFTKVLSPIGIAPFSLDGDGNSLPLPDDLKSQVFLTEGLFSSAGFGRMGILSHEGRISVPSGLSLDAGVGGSFTFESSNIDVSGAIIAPGGSISLRADLVPYDLIPLETVKGSEQPYRYLSEDTGNLRLEEGSVLSTAGLLTSDFLGFGNDPIMISGGSIKLAAHDLFLQKGAVVDVSGGVFVSSAGKYNYGRAGDIRIQAGADPQASGGFHPPQTPLADIQDGKLELGASLMGYSSKGIAGGTLEIDAPAFRIGGSALSGETEIASSFFSTGGFSSFTLAGTGVGMPGQDGYLPGLVIADGTQIHPIISSRILNDEGTTLISYLAPDPLRPTAQLTFSSTAIKDENLKDGFMYLSSGDLIMGSGASIDVDPQLTVAGTVATGSVTLSGSTVRISGSISVPGGKIKISADGVLPSNEQKPVYPQATLDLAPSAFLSAAGKVLTTFDPLGLRQRFGAVLPGGGISLGGNILAEGGFLDVSGTSGVLDFLPNQLGWDGQGKMSTRVDSAGGSITISGKNALYSDAILKGNAGGTSAAGGSVSFSSGTSDKPLTLMIVQTGSVLPSGIDPSDLASKVGSLLTPPLAISSPSMNGGGEVSLASFLNGGFASVSLGGGILFSGPISLSVPGTITAATAGILGANNAVTLSAAHVVLGQKFLTPTAPGISDQTLLGAPTGGADGAVPGSLTIENASLIDLGNLSLQGIRSTSFSAPGGAIRGDGTLDVTGALTLSAAEIYPAGSTSFKAVAYGYDSLTGKVLLSGGTLGQITVTRSGNPEIPLSGGGSLGLYADKITIGGSLIAPMGSIVLGVSGKSTDYLSNLTLPSTTSLTLESGSLVSVSGNGMTIPYGTSPDGQQWLDPSGFDINYRGVPGKSVILSASQVNTEKGSVVDISGGGELVAPQWVSGLGGTINWTGSGSPYGDQNSYHAGDLVLSGGSLWSAVQSASAITPVVGPYWTQLPNSYAILPGNPADFGPTGYSDGSIPVGQKVSLPAAGGLAAGEYTLLPVSYANLPGAYLLSEAKSGISGPPLTRPDGSILLPGIVFNSMDGAANLPLLASSFILSTPSVLAAKNQVKLFQADTFFDPSVASPKPADGGRVKFVSSSGMALEGSVSGSGSAGGVGARIDISSPLSIVINSNGSGNPGRALLLGANQLSSWSFGSLLLGGSRGNVQADGTTPVSVSSPSITIQDGTKLAGNDIILAANSLLSVGSEASLSASGSSSAPDEFLTLGGDGLLVRVSSDTKVTSSRTGVDSLETQLGFTDRNGNPAIPSLVLADGSSLSGKGVILDSSALANVSTTTSMNADSLSLSAGQIALLAAPTLTTADLDVSSANALVLSSSQLKGFSSASSLSFTSYSSLDLYGMGLVGSPSLKSLNIHAGEIRGFQLSGGEILLSAQSILLDNPATIVSPLGSDKPNVQPVGPGAVTAVSDGTIRITAPNLSLGVNGMTWDQFSLVSLEASSSVVGTASGSFSVGTESLPSDLIISTPLVTTWGGVSTVLSASGDFSLITPSANTLPITSSGVLSGGALTLQGSSLSLDSSILLPGGSLTASALSGDLTVGNHDKAILSVAGVSGILGTFLSDVRSSDAGSISLTSSLGNVIFGAESTLDLSATKSSSAGSLAVNTPYGSFFMDSKANINAQGGNSGGMGGSFSMDVKNLVDGNKSATASLDSIASRLWKASFNKLLSFRIRDGNVNIEGSGFDKNNIQHTLTAQSVTIIADNGTIDVTGKIDASGNNGGSISLEAEGSVILESGSALSVHGSSFDNAGKGGSVFLSAGSEVNGVINPNATLDLQSGSTIDLGVTAPSDRIDQFGGTLHLRAPLNADGNEVKVSEMASTITGASSVVVEAYQLYPSAGGSSEISSLIPQAITDAQTLLGTPGANSEAATAILTRLTEGLDPSVAAVLNLAPGVEIINQRGDLTLSQDLDLSTFRTGANSAPGFLNLRASGNIMFTASLSDGFSSGDYTATVLDHNLALPANFQDWNYSITAGADFSSANNRAVSKASSANVTLGVAGLGYDPGNGVNALTPQVIRGLYQVIRSGTGDISINASGDFQLWNQFASVYTAGTLAPDQGLGGTFDTPVARMNGIEATSLGAAQQIKVDSKGNPVFLQDVNGMNITDAIGNPLPVYQNYPAQFTIAGGNISIEVGGNIDHKAYERDSSGAVVNDVNGNPVVVDDPVRELPSNWLYRRGAIDLISGKFVAAANSDYQLDASGNVKLAVDGLTPLTTTTTEITSTAWWVDFSNFFEGVGALGGGNVTMKAGGTISNVDAVIPTQARMPGKTSITITDDTSLGVVANQSGNALNLIASMNGITIGMVRPAVGTSLNIPDENGDSYTVTSGDTLQSVGDAFGVNPSDLASANKITLADYEITKGSGIYVPIAPATQTMVETGGGDLTIRAGNNIDAGVYYIERGLGNLRAGGSIITNPSRDSFMPTSLANVADALKSTERASLPTTLFLGKSSFNVEAAGNVLLGPAANVFLMPQGINNGLNYTSFFSTFDTSSSVSVASLGGAVTLRQYSANVGFPVSPILMNWYQGDISPLPPPIEDKFKSSFYQPWIRLNTASVNSSASQMSIQPASLQAVSFGGDIFLQGSYTAAPSPSGNIILDAAGSVIGLSTDGAGSPTTGTTGLYISSKINLSDASPSSMPSPSAPVSSFNGLPFQETGSYVGGAAALQFKQQLHDSEILHKNDPNPLQIVARSGDLTGVTLFSPKSAQISSGGFIEDIGLYLQNIAPSDISLVSAGSGIIAFDDQTPYQRIAQAAGVGFTKDQLDQYKSRITGTGDIQISGPGTLEVISGGSIDLGNGPNSADGLGVGITSIGNSRNPALKFEGANVVLAAGMKPSFVGATGISSTDLLVSDLFATAKNLPDAASYYGELIFKSAGLSLSATGQLGITKGVEGLVENIVTSDDYLKKYQDLVSNLQGLEVNLKSSGQSTTSVTALLELLSQVSPQLQSLHDGYAADTSSLAFLQKKVSSGLADLTSAERDLLAAGILLDPSYRNSGDDTLSRAVFSAGSLAGIESSAFLSAAEDITPASRNEIRNLLALNLFYNVLRDSGRDHNDPSSKSYGSYKDGEVTINSFFGLQFNTADVILGTQSIRTRSGGSISILAPTGGLTLASVIPSSLNTLTPPGVVTEHGGSVDIYTAKNVDIGIGRIFTLRGGDIIMWSDKGDIAAGSSAKTVATAPPTRVLIDPTSGNVQTDLAGLATGGGIGVLDTVAGIPPGNVDLIAPSGVIDAGDAGIRSSGNLNLAAPKILNADNIVAAVTTGAPPATASAAPAPASAPAAAPPSAANAAAANNSAAETASKSSASSSEQDQSPSIFSIDILGYGGGDEDDDQDKKSANASVAPVQASL